MSRNRAVRKTRIPQEKNLINKTVLIPVMILVIGSTLMLIWSLNQTKSSIEAIRMIRPYIRSDGTVNDFQGVVGVKTEKDIRFYYDDDKENGRVKIDYGKIPITCSWKEFKTKEFQDMLATISISAKQYKDGRVILMWCGKKIERYVD